jgi:hypothetical protein
MPLSEREREIVKTLIDTKAVDFEAIGRSLSKFGPTAALEMDYEPVYCGTMRYYIHLYRLPNPVDGGSNPVALNPQPLPP